MSIASSRLFKMLIDVNCLSRVTWSGIGAKGKEKNIAFKTQTNIIKVLFENLHVMENTYTNKDLHDDILVVYKNYNKTTT